MTGEHLLVADDADGFAAAVILVLNDPALQDRLAENGRILAEQVYDRQVVLKKFDRIYPPSAGKNDE
jgi:glycosyltransferase involved in cell wall biosynthesis